MRPRRRWAVSTAAGTVCALALLPVPSASATAPGLSISVPSSVSFGSFAPGARTITASLGTVTVTTASTVAHNATWTATVTATDFTTGGGTSAERVPNSSVTYRSGTATASTGFGAGACVPGQALAASLGSMRTAFSCTGVSIAATTSLSWRPEITIAIAAGNVAGAYSGTITHSVA
jgi:hypothetical protein